MFISSPCQKIGVLNVGVMPSESKSYVLISREIQSEEIKFMSDATRKNLRGGGGGGNVWGRSRTCWHTEISGTQRNPQKQQILT